MVINLVQAWSLLPYDHDWALCCCLSVLSFVLRDLLAFSIFLNCNYTFVLPAYVFDTDNSSWIFGWCGQNFHRRHWQWYQGVGSPQAWGGNEITGPHWDNYQHATQSWWVLSSHELNGLHSPGLGHAPICTPGMPLKMESTILGSPNLGPGLDSKEIMHHSQNCKSSG